MAQAPRGPRGGMTARGGSKGGPNQSNVGRGSISARGRGRGGGASGSSPAGILQAHRNKVNTAPSGPRQGSPQPSSRGNSTPFRGRGSSPANSTPKQPISQLRQQVKQDQTFNNNGDGRSKSFGQKSRPVFNQPKPLTQDPRIADNVDSRYEFLEQQRDEERSQAIADGMLHDPKKKVTLENAITPVGTCEDMCPEFERVQRVKRHEVDRCEKVQNQAGSWEAAGERMVKKFARSDAGREEQLPSDIRTPEALVSTMDYLIEDVIGKETRLIACHNFIWDRTRAIRNDFSIQQVSSEDAVRMAVDCHERSARFLILSLHILSNRTQLANGEHFDAQQDVEQLNKTFTSLWDYYDAHRLDIDFPNEAEFRSYQILFEIQSAMPDLEDRMQSWPYQVLSDERVQTALRLHQLATDTLRGRGPMRPLTAEMVAQMNGCAFWDALSSSTVSYLMACVAELSFWLIRFGFLKVLWKSVKSIVKAQRERMKEWTVSQMKDYLGFDSDDEVEAFCHDLDLGFYGRNEKGQKYLDFSQDLEFDFGIENAPRKQIFSQQFVEEKRLHRSYAAIINGVGVSQAIEMRQITSQETEMTKPEEVEDADADGEGSMFFPETTEPAINTSDSMPQQAQAKPAFGSGMFSSFNPAANPFKPQGGVFGKQSQPATDDTAMASNLSTPVLSAFSNSGSLGTSFAKPVDVVNSKDETEESKTTRLDQSKPYDQNHVFGGTVFSPTNNSFMKKPTQDIPADQDTETMDLSRPYNKTHIFGTAKFVPEANIFLRKPENEDQQNSQPTESQDDVSNSQKFVPPPNWGGNLTGNMPITFTKTSYSHPASPETDIFKRPKDSTTSSAAQTFQNLWSKSTPDTTSAHQPAALLTGPAKSSAEEPKPEGKVEPLTILKESLGDTNTRSQQPELKPTSVIFPFSANDTQSISPRSAKQPIFPEKTQQQLPTLLTQAIDLSTSQPFKSKSNSKLSPPLSPLQVKHPISTTPPSSPPKSAADKKRAAVDIAARLSITQPGGLLAEYLDYTLEKLLPTILEQYKTDNFIDTIQRLKRVTLSRKFGSRWRTITREKALNRRAVSRRSKFAQSLKIEARKKRRREDDLQDIMAAIADSKRVKEEQARIKEEDQKKGVEIGYKEDRKDQQPQLADRKRKSTDMQPPSHYATQAFRDHKRSRTLGSSIIPPAPLTPETRQKDFKISLFSTGRSSLSQLSQSTNLRESQQSRFYTRPQQDNTQSDFFKLLARNVDPSTPLIPLTQEQIDNRARKEKTERDAKLEATYNRRQIRDSLSSPRPSASPEAHATADNHKTQSSTESLAVLDNDNDKLLRQIRETKAMLAEGTDWFREQSTTLEKELEEFRPRSSRGSRSSPQLSAYTGSPQSASSRPLSRTERLIQGYGLDRPRPKYKPLTGSDYTPVAMSKRTAARYQPGSREDSVEAEKVAVEGQANGTARKRWKHHEIDPSYRPYPPFDGHEEVKEDDNVHYPELPRKRKKHTPPRQAIKVIKNPFETLHRLQQQPMDGPEDDDEEKEDDDEGQLDQNGVDRDTDELLEESDEAGDEIERNDNLSEDGPDNYGEEEDDLLKDEDDEEEDDEEDYNEFLRPGSQPYDDDAPTPATNFSQVSSGPGATKEDAIALSDSD